MSDFLMKAYLFCSLLILILSTSDSFGSESERCSPDERLAFESVQISGNEKTSIKFIEMELGLSDKEWFCKNQIQEKINRLKRTGLFSKVEYTITRQNRNDLAELRIAVIEKWTTIPILKLNSGGGVSQYTIGVYDPNILGEFLEAGAQYENLGGASSGVVWFKNPRLFGKPQGIDLQYWNTRRIRIKYDQDKSDPEIKRGFLHEREKVYADYFRDISSKVTLRFSLEYNKDSFSTEILPDSVIHKNGPNLSLPPSTELLISKVGLEVGDIVGEPQALSGQSIGAHFGYANSLDSSADPFVQIDLSFHLFKSILPRWQLAQRLIAGVTSTQVLQYWYYLGGLDRIRGFADNRFAGSHFAVSNSETRYLMFEKPSYFIQGVGFVDFGAVGDEASEMTKVKAASLGAGLRLILPKFYRFIVRLDYAKPILKSDTMNWSFGVQQFF
ncbi:MAG: BamA/TamA family outer membrane protein [Bdellovibrionales bacterium]|nr:BamA/TamA family outer membrane protein [Bdellovibrionales bacterium]